MLYCLTLTLCSLPAVQRHGRTAMKPPRVRNVKCLEKLSCALGYVASFLHLYPISCLTKLPQPFFGGDVRSWGRTQASKVLSRRVSRGGRGKSQHPADVPQRLWGCCCRKRDQGWLRSRSESEKERGFLNWRLFWWGQWERQGQPQPKNQTESSSE